MTTSTLDSRLRGAEVESLRVPRQAFFTPVLRWLLVLVGVVALLYSSYSELTGWRSYASNAVSYPVTPDGRFGQTFVARYPDLSGIELRLSKKKLNGPRQGATLVMHVRAAQGPGPDLATVTRRFNTDIEESSYHLFSFPPIHDSEGKSYYVEIDSPDGHDGNALALLWWIQFDSNLFTDPYVGGTAYFNDETQQADLAFGLRYSASPTDVFAQLVRSIAPDFPRKLMLLIFLGAIIPPLVALYLIRRRKYTIQGAKAVLLKWSLPVALWAALLTGLTFAWLIPPWQGPDEHGHFMYAALLDRHGLDNGAVQRLDWNEGGKDHAEALALKTAIVASMDRYEWTRRVAGHPTPGASAFPPGSADLYSQFLWELRQPPAYYWLCASSLRVARALGVEADPLADPATALRVMRLVSVLLNMWVVALAWGAGILLGAKRYPWLRLLLPLTVALLPMHTFIASIVSNDIISELAVSALFVSLVALLKWPVGRRGASLAAVVVLCFLACAATKLTAVVAGGLLLLLGLLVWVGLLVTTRRDRRESRRGQVESTIRTQAGSILRFLAIPGAVVACCLLLCLVGLSLIFESSQRVAAWQGVGGPSTRPNRVQTSSAHSGSYVMQIEPNDAAFQWVELPWPHGEYSATLSLWVRTAKEGLVPPNTVIAQAEMILDKRGTLSRIGAETLPAAAAAQPITYTATSGWVPFTMTARGTPADRKLWVRMHSSYSLQFDDLSLYVSAAGPITDTTASDPSPRTITESTPLPLFNPSAEIGSISVSPLGARLLRGETSDIVDVLVNPQAFDKSEIWERYASRQYRSFWGNFGWLSISLPDGLYTLIGAMLLLALVGLSVKSLRSLGRWSSAYWLGLITVVSLLAAITVTFARQMGPLSTSGVHTDPQGRYLFGFTVPVVWLVLSGLWAVWSLLARWVRHHAGGPMAIGDTSEQAIAPADAKAVLLPWPVWLWCGALFFFGAYCLLALIAPYYYG